MAAEPGAGGIENGRCFAEAANHTSPPLFQNGELVFQAHHVGWLISGFFASVAVVTSFWLIDQHLQWYTNKAQQRQIVRLLLMVPIYAFVSLLSYIYWNHATAIVLMRDCYESFVLYSFFYLLLLYVSDDPMEQREVFKNYKLDKWMFPLGFVKYRPEDGLYFLQLMKWGVLQYSVLRPLCTLASVGLNYVGLYCELSYSPAWGHIYLVSIISISVSIAMYCLFQLYFAIKTELAPQKPLLKLFSIKAVVFLTFWQATFLGVLASFGFIKDTKYMTAEDINIGIGAILETFEMMLFAFLHVKAFTYKPYKDLAPDGKRTPRLRGLRHAFWYRDMWKEFKDGCIYLWRRMRGKEAEKLMRKQIHLENAMGRSRRMDRGPGGGIRPQPTRPKEGMPGERPELPWLNVENDGLEAEVGLELEKRGMGSRAGDQELLDARGIGHSRKQASWWRRAYDRVSGRGSTDEQYSELHSPKEKLRSPRSPRSPHGKFDEDDIDLDPLDEPPPPSIIFKNPNRPRGSAAGGRYAQVAHDEPDEDGRRRNRRDRGGDRGRGGDYVPQRSQPLAPLDFRPRADHHRDDDLAHPGTDSPRTPSSRPPPPELSRSPPPGALRGPAELSRSPPPRAAMFNAPTPPAPQSVARTDSLLGRVFARPAVDETALSHADKTSDGALSRSMSLASDPRQHVKEVEPVSIAAVMGQAPTVESFALDSKTHEQTGPDAKSERSEAQTRHRVEATLPPLPPPSPGPEEVPPPPAPKDVFAEVAASSPAPAVLNDVRHASPFATVPPSTPTLPPPQPASGTAQAPQQTSEPKRGAAQRYSVPVGAAPRNLPRPNKLVMPTPLSPARFPGESAVRGQVGDGPSLQAAGSAMQAPGPSDARRRNEFSPPMDQQGYDMRQQQYDMRPQQYQSRPEDPRRGRPYDPRQGPPLRQEFSPPMQRPMEYGRDVRPPPRQSYPPPPPQQYGYDSRPRDTPPEDRGRALYRAQEPRYSRQYNAPQPPLPGLEYLPHAPPAPPLSPPHAAMFPSSPVTSPERDPRPYPPMSPPGSMSPSRMMRLPRDDVPVSRPEATRQRSSMAIDPARDVVGPKHPQVQRMAGPRRTTLDSTIEFAPAGPGEILRPLDTQPRQDRRLSAPVGYGQPQQRPFTQQQAYGSPPRQRQYAPPPQAPYGGNPQRPRMFSDPPPPEHMRQRPPGAAAPFVSSQQQQFPETISPMPVRPSHNHVRNLTPPTPEPTTGLVPYIPRSERARNAGGGGGAPWT